MTPGVAVRHSGGQRACIDGGKEWEEADWLQLPDKYRNQDQIEVHTIVNLQDNILIFPTPIMSSFSNLPPDQVNRLGWVVLLVKLL